MQLMLIAGIVFAIGAVVFALQNNSAVVVTLALWNFEGSLAVVLLAAVGLGVLITGLGPVGLAAAMLAKAMGAGPIIGSDISQARRTAALELGLVHHAVPPEGLDERVAHVTGAGCEVAVDCSGNAQARHAALRNTRAWGRCVFLGEGGSVEFAVSDLLIHKQITLYGSWVTSVLHTEELLANLVRWNLHPECIVTHRYPLAQAAQAYEVAAAGQSGKVCIVFDELPGSVVPIDGSRP